MLFEIHRRRTHSPNRLVYKFIIYQFYPVANRKISSSLPSVSMYSLTFASCPCFESNLLEMKWLLVFCDTVALAKDLVASMMLGDPNKSWRDFRWYRVRRCHWYRAASPRGSCSRFQGPEGEWYDKEGVVVEEVGDGRGGGKVGGGIDARW